MGGHDEVLEVLVTMWSNANEYGIDYRNSRAAISWTTVTDVRRR